MSAATALVTSLLLPPPPLLLLLLPLLLSPVTAFLATDLNHNDPKLKKILCGGENEARHRSHEFITREGIKLSIREAILEDSPIFSNLFLPMDATLEQIFTLYFGKTSSPTRFLNAIREITDRNIFSDSYPHLRHEPYVHATAERAWESHEKLASLYPLLISTILTQDSFQSARTLLGFILHTIQDFYAHSTWINLHNNDIIPEFGIPGDNTFLPRPALGDRVCKPCIDIVPTKKHGVNVTCHDNVIENGVLSSGYYTYKVSPKDAGRIVPKPRTDYKCSHGGVLDDSSIIKPNGGINKDTPYSCFSPHHYLHEQAAELAVKATKKYLDKLRHLVGFNKFRRLFDLYKGNALSVTIDTTATMKQIMPAVKKEIIQIAEVIQPEIYILSKYKDPQCELAIKTSDAEMFKDEVSRIFPSGGDGMNDPFWCALQIALTRTPPYGNIFCFTDGFGNDNQNMDAIIDLAELNNVKVNVILSKSAIGGDRYGNGSLADYTKLVNYTGGHLIFTSEFNINTTVKIMDTTILNSTVTLVTEVVREQTTRSFPVDLSLHDIQLEVAGKVASATLSDVEHEITYDLKDQAKLMAAGVEIITYNEEVMMLRWIKPNRGEWRVALHAKETTTLSITGVSTLDFIASFAVLDARPPHPHFRPLRGDPITSMSYYLRVELVGFIENEVAVVSGIDFINKKGVSLVYVEYPLPVKELEYIQLPPLPSETFFITISGVNSLGQEWSRQMPTKVHVLESSVEIYANTKNMKVHPKTTVKETFTLTNYGPQTDFVITATDDNKYISTVNPKHLNLTTNETKTFEISFNIPPLPKIGTVDTVLVRVKGVENQMTATVRSYLHILPEEKDTIKPKCTVLDTTACGNYTNNGICFNKTWSVTAFFKDDETGMYGVFSLPDIEPQERPSPQGTKQLNVTFETDCCTLEVELRGVDLVGNMIKCPPINMGQLGGLIQNVTMTPLTTTSIKVTWMTTVSTIPIEYFNIIIDQTHVHSVQCKKYQCETTIDNLAPCVNHPLKIVPFFRLKEGGHSRIVEGEGVETIADTFPDDMPAVETPFQVNATVDAYTISWRHPVPPSCRIKYVVCMHEVLTDIKKCKSTYTTTLNFHSVLPCRAYVNYVHTKHYVPLSDISYNIPLMDDYLDIEDLDHGDNFEDIKNREGAMYTTTLCTSLIPR